MAQKPFTITRVPKPRPDAAASKPAGQTTPTNPSACPTCGALVADTALHSAHHDRTDKWATRVNEVLRAVVAALRTPNPFPKTDNPATESENPNA